MGEDDLLIIENGYFRERFPVETGKAQEDSENHFGKRIPRSRKIRLYVMGRFTEEEALTYQKIKFTFILDK